MGSDLPNMGPDNELPKQQRMMRAKRWRWSASFGLAVLSMVIAIAMTEVALRLYHDDAMIESLRARNLSSPPPKFVDHPFLPLVGRPSSTSTKFENVNGKNVEVEIHNNSYGYRTHEFRRKKDGDFVVVCLGGSTTWGEAAPRNSMAWPGQLESLLSAALPEHEVRVYNLGVPTATSANSVVAFSLLGTRLTPDIVIVYHGTNEIGALVRDAKWDYSHHQRSVGRGDEPWATRLPRWMQSSLAALMAAESLDILRRRNDLSGHVQTPFSLSDVAEAGARVLRTGRLGGLIVESDMQIMFENFETIEALARSRGGRTLFSTFQFGNPDVLEIEFNRRLRDWYEATAKSWVDVDLAIPDQDVSKVYDDCHFTREGEEMMARVMFDAIVEKQWLPQP